MAVGFAGGAVDGLIGARQDRLGERPERGERPAGDRPGEQPIDERRPARDARPEVVLDVDAAAAAGADPRSARSRPCRGRAAAVDEPETASVAARPRSAIARRPAARAREPGSSDRRATNPTSEAAVASAAATPGARRSGGAAPASARRRGRARKTSVGRRVDVDPDRAPHPRTARQGELDRVAGDADDPQAGSSSGPNQTRRVGRAVDLVAQRAAGRRRPGRGSRRSGGRLRPPRSRPLDRPARRSRGPRRSGRSGPLSSSTSRRTAASGCSPNSTPPPGRVQAPASTSSADSRHEEDPLVAVDGSPHRRRVAFAATGATAWPSGPTGVIPTRDGRPIRRSRPEQPEQEPRIEGRRGRHEVAHHEAHRLTDRGPVGEPAGGVLEGRRGARGSPGRGG